MIVIYGLTDPRTGSVRYVGKTSEAKHRLVQHLHDGRKTTKTKNKKSTWLRELHSLGLKPGFKVLERVSRGSWPKAEKKWRAKLPDLTNGNQGGGGLPDGVRMRHMNLTISADLYRRMEKVRKKVRFNASEVFERALEAEVTRLEKETRRK